MTIQVNEKVVGTTFVDQKPVEELTGTLIKKEETPSGVPEFHTTAVLVPEPTNPYDPGAVAVYVETKDGMAHRVGYVAKTSEIKSKITRPTSLKLTIVGYSMVGLSDSFILKGEID